MVLQPAPWGCGKGQFSLPRPENGATGGPAPVHPPAGAAEHAVRRSPGHVLLSRSLYFSDFGDCWVEDGSLTVDKKRFLGSHHVCLTQGACREGSVNVTLCGQWGVLGPVWAAGSSACLLPLWPLQVTYLLPSINGGRGLFLMSPSTLSFSDVFS